MARIKHIALVTDDPVKTAEFYKQHFGLTELYRRPSDTGEKGVWLSDGYIYFAILKYGDADAPKLGPGQTSDLRGIHHIGFQVDDLEATAKALERDGIRCAAPRSRPQRPDPDGHGQRRRRQPEISRPRRGAFRRAPEGLGRGDQPRHGPPGADPGQGSRRIAAPLPGLFAGEGRAPQGRTK